MPEVRLLVKMAAARGVSGRRRGRLLPWSEQATSRRAVCGASVGEVAGRPKFVRAPWVMPLPEVAGAGSEVVGSHWTVCRRGWWVPEICPGSVVVALLEEPEQAARPWAVSGPTVGGAVGGPFLFGQGIGSVCGKVTPVAGL